MNTDRELLELAAKAAGLWDAENNCIDIPWTPLTDDGDALRLAVKLRLDLRFIDNGHSQGIEPSRVTFSNVSGIVENIDADPCAATRLAIVRAAAEIGRGMD